MVGSADQDDAQVKGMVAQVGCAAVSVDYRLAPETPFPGPVEDCYAALKWPHAHAAELRPCLTIVRRTPPSISRYASAASIDCRASAMACRRVMGWPAVAGGARVSSARRRPRGGAAGG